MKIKQFKCFFIGLPIIWYYLGTLDKKNVRKISFDCGLLLSADAIPLKIYILDIK